MLKYSSALVFISNVIADINNSEFLFLLRKLLNL